MEFELHISSKKYSDSDLLNDLKRVADELKINTLTIPQYQSKGKFSYSSFQSRFGSWLKSLEKAGLSIDRINEKISKDDIIKDLISVAEKLKKDTITSFEYENYGKYSPSAVSNHYKGSWLKALQAAGLQKSRKYGVTNEEYFDNIEKVWIKLGRQPKYKEIQRPISLFSAGAYERRFGTWSNALEEFVKYINTEKVKTDLIIEEKILDSKVEKNSNEIIHKTKREINHRLRFIVMRRDNFKCRICGKSPANDPGITLHVDHIKSWRKGGETILDNLQTLCSVCNIGKSDLEMTEIE